MQKIIPFLWFNDNAEEAVDFYISIFKNSRVLNVARYGASGPGPQGSVMIIAFLLNDQKFLALNGGPAFKFNEAISMVVQCDTQEELDAIWKKLSSGGGQEVQCGWLKDKYGLSWQIVPSILPELMKDPKRGERVMGKIMKMVKIDIKTLQEA